MGAAPSTCPNRYDGPIVSAVLSSGGRTYNILAQNSGPFLVDSQGSYTLVFVIHTQSTSSQGNTNPGDTWYNTNAPGFGDGVCVSGAGPDQNVTVSVTYSNRMNGNEWLQGVGFGTLVNGYGYDIQWVKPQNPDYMLFPSSSSVTVGQNGFASDTMTVTSLSNFSGTVSLNVSSPPGITLRLNPSSVDVPAGGSATSTLDIATNADSSGTFPVTVTGTSGSDTDSRQVTVTVPTPPSAPHNLVTVSGVSQMNLLWDAPYDNGGSPVTSYQVYRGTASGGETLLATTGTSLNYLDSNATAGVTYYYYVRAVSANGASPASNEAILPGSGAPNKTFLSDHFDSSLDGWSYYGDTGYALSLNATTGKAAPSAQIAGDAYLGNCSDHGMAKAADISTLGQGPLVLALNWRAASSGPGTTNAFVDVYNADNGSLIFKGTISAGNSGDTGWQYYATDLSSVARGVSHVRIFPHLTDCWSTNWAQEDWFDNIELFSPHYPEPSAPSSPGYVSASSSSSTQVGLSWSPPESNGGSPITGYSIFRGTSSGSESPLASAGNTTTYNDTTASSGTPYFYRVAASSVLGQSPYSNEAREAAEAPPSINVNPPSAPQSLAASASGGHVTISWSAPSGNGGSGIYNYNIYRGTTPGTESLLARIGNVTSYSDSAVSVGKTYYYEVSATNSAGESPRSGEASVTVPPTAPGSPTGLDAVAYSPDTIYLSWSAPSNSGGAAVTGYSVERSSDNGTTWSGIATTGNTTYADRGLGADTYYSYRVSAQNSAGTGPYSGTASARTPPLTSTSKLFLNDTFDSGLEGWQHYGNTGYDVTTDNSTGVPAPSAHISGFAYLGNCSKHGMAKSIDISGYTGGPLLLKFNWRASSTSGVDSTTAEVRVDDASTGSQLFVHRLTNNSAVLDTNWQYYSVDISPYVAGHPKIQVDMYLFSCWDTDYHLNNWYDNIALVQGTSPPSAPSGLAASASPSQVSLTWNQPAGNGGSPVTAYKVYRGTASGSETFLAQAGNDTAYNDTSVTGGTTYYYKVSAVNANGESSQSNEAQATVPSSGITISNTQHMSGATSSAHQVTLAGFDAGSGANRLLLVGVSADNSNVNSITYQGISLARAAGSFYNDDSEFWYLADPPTGTGDILVTMAGSAHLAVGAYLLSGVDATDPVPSSTATDQSTGNPSITITTKYPDSYVADLPSTYGGSTLSSPTCKEGWEAGITGGVTGGSSTEATTSAGSVTCSWNNNISSNGWDDTAVEVKALAASSNLKFSASNSTNPSG